MWLVRINWLRQFSMSLVFIGATLCAVGYAYNAGLAAFARPFLWPSYAGAAIVGILSTLILAYLAIGSFLNGVRSAAASFRAKFQWRTPRAPNIIPALAVMTLALSLSACAANKPELPQAKGAWIHLNGDKYPADQNDISHAPPESGRLVGARQ